MANLSNINNKFLVTTGGDVGIGTTSPTSKLHINSSDTGLRVVGSSRSQILLENSTSAWQIESPTSTGNVPAGALGIIQAGVGSRLSILTSGNVGIGITSPTEKLSVNGNISLNRYLSLSNSDYTYILGKRTSPSDGFYLTRLMGYGDNTFYGSFDVLRHDADDGELRFRTRTAGAITDVMTIVDGNVGIGTSSPTQSKLVISGGSTGTLGGGDAGITMINKFDNPDNSFSITPQITGIANTGLSIRDNTDSADRLVIDGSGNIGIGTSSPSYKLDVNSGVSNVVARFESTDGTAGIMLKDSTGNVELTTSATNGFNVQPAGGTAAFVVTGSGNVGINTTGPTSKLDVREAANNVYTAYFYNSATDANAHGVNIQTATTNSAAYAFRVNSGSDSNALTVMGDGNVGIGANSPGTKLEVRQEDDTFNDLDLLTLKRVWSTASGSDRAHGIKFNDNNATLANIYADRTNSGSNYNSDLVFITNTGASGTNTSEKMRITSAGNVGIGTASPKTNLEVIGGLNVSTNTTSATTTTMRIGSYGFSSQTYYGAKLVAHTDFTSTANADLSFDLGGLGEVMRLHSSGSETRVGIGTTSPSQKLEVTGNFKLNGTLVQEGTGNNLTFRHRTGNSYSYTGGSATCKFGRFYWTPAHWVTGAPVIKVTLHSKYYQGERREYIIKAGYQDTDPIINELQPSSTLRRITLSVGATTSAGYNYANQPVYYVDLQWVQTSYMWGWAEVESQVAFLTSNPTSGWGGVVMDSSITQNNLAGLVRNYNTFFAGNVGIGLTSPSDKLEVTTGENQYTGRFDYTGSSSSVSAYGCLKLRLSASTSPSFIDLFYDGYSTNPLTPVGAIVTTGSSVLYSSFSDYRLKENIADLTGALDKVNSLQPKTFNYINRPETTNEGFLAHELQEIVPQAVSGTKDGVDENGNPKYQGVDNAHLVPLLVGAIKELKANNDSLKARIETLENK